MEPDDEAEILGHYSDALNEMAQSLMDLEDGYFNTLCEVIIETERALWDISHIDSHYVSRVVTVMAGWQEAVQTATSHMENANLTMYLTRHEDVHRAMKEYMKEVITAHKERVPPTPRRSRLGRKPLKPITMKTQSSAS